ncbi:MAG: site-specific integrase, partial [Propionibacteriales bacterium]|nr:site-specific integrase [Propionibacteriales bacterium]
MAYVVERKRSDGSTRFLACYRDPEGRIRSAGTHPTRRAAERAAHRQEQKVLAGSWRDASLGTVT